MYVITLSSKLLITSSARCYRKHVLKCNTHYEYDTCHLMLLKKKESNEKRDKGKKHRNNRKTKSNSNDETKTNRIIYIIQFSSI